MVCLKQADKQKKITILYWPFAETLTDTHSPSSLQRFKTRVQLKCMKTEHDTLEFPLF